MGSLSLLDHRTGLDAAHRWQWQLCARLEALADGLPALPSGADLGALQAALGEVARTLLLPLPDAPPGSRQARDLARARGYRLADACHADDLADALNEAREHGVRPERLGYMLRCFFDGRRRAIDHERAVLGLPTLAGDQSPANA